MNFNSTYSNDIVPIVINRCIYYTGIGSRETPIPVLEVFRDIAAILANHNLILRSGHAPGADINFELGCDSVNGNKEIYVPWIGFEGSDSILLPTRSSFEIAREYHPYWDDLSMGAKKLQARNSNQVLGKDLLTPSLFVLCWTKNGKGAGGTGQAIRISKDYNIPIFDAGIYKDINVIKESIKLFITEVLGYSIFI